MRLTEQLLTPYLDYVLSGEAEDARLTAAQEWRARARSGVLQLANYFVSLSAGNVLNAAAHILSLHESTYAIILPGKVLQDPNAHPSNIECLIEEALERLRELGIKYCEFRLTEKDHLLPLSKRLPQLGFRQSHTRIEFQAQITDLPSEVGTPLAWVAVSERESFTLNDAAQILERAGEGDPDWNTQDNSLELLQAYLGDPEFKSNLACIHIALFGGKTAAIVIAQVMPTSGWSRITYMGLLPEFRKRGLGKWVHRHGFEMMRTQGGKLYHGGTVRGNLAMEALFRQHGCVEYRTMQEWKIQL